MSLIGGIIAAGLEAVFPAKAETVRYVIDGDFAIEELQAAKTKPVNRGDLAGVGAVRYQGDDWFIRVADLVRDGVEFVPEAGHRIEWTRGDNLWVYQVLADDKDAVFDYRDSGHSQFRVFTKLIEVEYA